MLLLMTSSNFFLQLRKLNEQKEFMEFDFQTDSHYLNLFYPVRFKP